MNVTISHFIRFLKEKGVYKAFFENCKEFNAHYRSNYTVKKLFEEYKEVPDYILSHAFTWSEAKHKLRKQSWQALFSEFIRIAENYRGGAEEKYVRK